MVDETDVAIGCHIMLPVCRAALVLLGFVGIAGCNRLPAIITYRADLFEDHESSVEHRLDEISGSDLKHDGKVVGQLLFGEGGALSATWSGPKEDMRAAMTGRYTTVAKGGCGPYDVTLSGPPDKWTSMSDDELTKSVKRNGFLIIYLTASLAPKQRIYVDWGEVKGTLMIGATKVDPGAKELTFVAGGCAGAPAVVLDGKPIGAIDPKAPASLVTLEPNVCHIQAEVAYGEDKAAKAPTRYPAKPVVSLVATSAFVLESAPSSMKVAARDKGTTTTELVRTPCGE